jgi:L-ascorbate metabolism protein UlaG (beta-lactamase superfamily)
VAALNRLRRYSVEVPRAIADRGVTPTGVVPVAVRPELNTAPLAAAWLGHASVLLRLGNQWVLTDPVFSARIGIPIGPLTIGLGRLQPPPDTASLPRPDVILLSHAHFDHLDKPSLRKLANQETRVITAAGTGRLVPRGFAQVDELGWDRELVVGGLTLRAMQPRHWGARISVDRHRGYNSYVIDSDLRRVLFAGDTALTDRFKVLASEPRKTDLAVFGIGAYDPWIHNHASPEQVWTMFNESGAKRLMPMHHSTFKLSDEPAHEPLTRLFAAAGTTREVIVGHELGSVWSEE